MDRIFPGENFKSGNWSEIHDGATKAKKKTFSHTIDWPILLSGDCWSDCFEGDRTVDWGALSTPIVAIDASGGPAVATSASACSSACVRRGVVRGCGNPSAILLTGGSGFEGGARYGGEWCDGVARAGNRV
jgi:hypothetical protein